MTLEDFKTQLEQHDWFYYYNSQLNNVIRGEKRQKQLKQIATLSADHQALFNEYNQRSLDAIA